jgi:hypothetical protein
MSSLIGFQLTLKTGASLLRRTKEVPISDKILIPTSLALRAFFFCFAGTTDRRILSAYSRASLIDVSTSAMFYIDDVTQDQQYQHATKPLVDF